MRQSEGFASPSVHLPQSDLRSHHSRPIRSTRATSFAIIAAPLISNIVTFCNKCGDPVGLQLKYDQAECEERGMTYAAPLKVTIRLTVYAKDAETGRRAFAISRNRKSSSAKFR